VVRNSSLPPLPVIAMKFAKSRIDIGRATNHAPELSQRASFLGSLEPKPWLETYVPGFLRR